MAMAIRLPSMFSDSSLQRVSQVYGWMGVVTKALLFVIIATSAFAQPSFLYPITILMGAPVSSIVGGDFNDDGIGDFAVAYGASLAVFLGKSDGTFIRKDLPPPPTGEMLLAAVDVNGDHKLDLVWSGSVMDGNGDGTFQIPVALNITLNPFGYIIAIADFNGDGIPDFAAVHENPVTSLREVTTLLGNGDGSFQPPGPGSGVINSSFFGTTVVAADLNHDGFADLVWTDVRGVPQVWLGNADGSLRFFGGLGVPISLLGLFFPVTAGDLNGDGWMDIVEQASNGTEVLLGRNNKLGFLDQLHPSPLFTAGRIPPPPLITLADVDSDKTLDVASCYYVLQGVGNGAFRPAIYFGQMGGASASLYQNLIVIQDVNGDGKPDIIGIGSDGQSINVLINSTGTPVASASGHLAATGEPVLAPGAIGTLYGSGLSTILGGTSVELVDFAGKTFQAPLLYVSPAQINFQVPDGVAMGLAIINVTGNGRPKGAHSTNIQQVATGIFTLDGSGSGAPFASAVSVAADGTQTAIAANPLTLPSNGQVYLSLYGTGFRHATAGTCAVGNATVTPSYYGAQGADAVLDQVNIPIPANTAKGKVDIACHFQYTVGDGYAFGNGNTVTITVQ